MIKYISKNIKPLIPKLIYENIRKVFTAVLTPIFFSKDTGHFKSSMKSLAVDNNSKPICWFSYPAIDYLETLDFKNIIVLEFGSGQSTLWWQQRCLKISSFENDKKWFDHIQKHININNSLNLIQNNKLSNQQLSIVKSEKFDVLIIDGSYDRFEALNLSINYLSEKGIVIIDNSEGYYTGKGQDKYGYFPMLKLMKEKKFCRIDFFGYAPGVIIPHSTSIFFKNNSFIFDQDNFPKISRRSLEYEDRKLKKLI